MSLLIEHIFTEYDNYYNDNYSSYPTDDNKYECRTGPFEGLSVSSVEFRKHVKFDDRKDHARDNRTGTQGPPSPQGAPGIKGTQGPPRITQLINGTNVYLVTKSSIDQPNAQVQSFCQPGDFVINGGYLYQGNVGDATIFPF